MQGYDRNRAAPSGLTVAAGLLLAASACCTAPLNAAAESLNAEQTRTLEHLSRALLKGRSNEGRRMSSVRAQLRGDLRAVQQRLNTLERALREARAPRVIGDIGDNAVELKQRGTISIRST
ncbi:MAG: hypothetical protein ACR2RL_20145, partial [Gammaproteobacteria bacterium]